MVDPDPRTAGAGLRRLADAGLDVCIGVEAAACQALNAPFIHRILEKVGVMMMMKKMMKITHRGGNYSPTRVIISKTVISCDRKHDVIDTFPPPDLSSDTASRLICV